MHGFAGGWALRAGEASSFRAAWRQVQDYRRHLEEQARRAAAAAQRLKDYDGVDGVDEEGRRLDQREFAETKQALQWLATCHMGWYRRDDANAYQPDLLERLGSFESRGLPDPHGIVMHVSNDRQRWYAYRRTVTGWVFAIGASDAPPNQWRYDGSGPPSGFPGDDPAWGESMFADNARNW
jgi:hypothetical protein